MSQDNHNPEAREATRDVGAAADGVTDRYHGFSLRSVTWGYRDVFRESIESLFQQGCLGPHRREVTSRFFELLKRSDQRCFDHVLRQFLGALSPANRWIMDLPGVFADLVDVGGGLAEGKLCRGVEFFRTLAAGGMGESPNEVRECLNRLRRLREIDEDLAMAFLAGYGRLSRRLRPTEMDRYIEIALNIHRGNNETGRGFLRGELSTSEQYILAITRECALRDMTGPLRALTKALADTDCEIADLGELDSDEVIGRGTSTLTLSAHLYLPQRIRRFNTAEANRRWYLLCGVASAAMIREDSFPRIHGHPRYRTCADLAGGEPWRVNLFQILEFARVLRRARVRWPGARRLVEWGLRTELSDAAARGGPERLLSDTMADSADTPALGRLRRVADDSVNCLDSARRIGEPWGREVLRAYPEIGSRPLRPLGFLSDFMFPISFCDPMTERRVADLEEAAEGRLAGEEQAAPALEGDDARDGEAGDRQTHATPEAAFVYDEWDFRQDSYRAEWCRVHQQVAAPAALDPRAELWPDEARKVRAIFERLKPEITRREKHLADGDDINPDLLLSHLVDRHREPSPPARFYEKPIVNRRDLAVLILLDVSGSTGEQSAAPEQVLDVEKHAAVILGQGLATLGDRFAVCGFSSNGRSRCEYLLFKGFDDSWGADAIGRVMSAQPRHSTRIGPALRHSGRLLFRQPARRRLIILITDGKPMDEGYDPNTRYAQHDVRMACEENLRGDVHTFAISTEENSLADMEIMFPHRRFAILTDIRQLPRLLPQLYLRLTV